MNTYRFLWENEDSENSGAGGKFSFLGDFLQKMFHVKERLKFENYLLFFGKRFLQEL